MASEELLPDVNINRIGWETIGGNPDDFLTVVADEFGGVGTFIRTVLLSATTRYGFAPPVGTSPITRIDVKVEASWNTTPFDLDADLFIDGVWQGVRSIALTNAWQVYTFGNWLGSWTPVQVAASEIKLMSAPTGKTGTLSIATLRQVVTSGGSGGRMLLTGVGP